MSSTSIGNLNVTVGALFIGLTAAAIFYGVTLVQTYIYFRNYPNDSRTIKSMVLVLWGLDTLHVILCTITVYWFLITSYGQPDKLGETYWAMNLQTDCNGLIGLIVECFFARRVWMMSKNSYLTGIIVVLSILHFGKYRTLCAGRGTHPPDVLTGLGVVFTAYEFVLKQLSELPKLLWVTTTGLGAAAACDILIAVSLCWYLSKSRTGFYRTDSLITTLMVYSLNTGLLTSVIAFLCVVLFATMNNLVWLGFFWVLGKCYVNSLLATLNSRESLRERATTLGPENSFHLSPVPHLSQDSHGGGLSPMQKMQKDLMVVVQTTTTSKSDYPESPTRAARPSLSHKYPSLYTSGSSPA